MKPVPNPVIREGFGPRYEHLSKQSSEILLHCIMADSGKTTVAEGVINDLPFPSAVVQKRVMALNLPIKFTTPAYLAISALCKGPGHAVVLLIDVLTQYEGQEVTTGMLCDLYPEGFYENESLGELIDKFMKPKKTKWSELY